MNEVSARWTPRYLSFAQILSRRQIYNRNLTLLFPDEGRGEEMFVINYMAKMSRAVKTPSQFFS